MARRIGDRNRPLLLIGCYFIRNLALDGVGSFVRGITVEMVRRGWDVRLLLPKAEPVRDEHVEVIGYDDGLFDYLQTLKTVSRDAAVVLLAESNPNLGFTSSFSSAVGRTYSYFYTPLLRMSDVWRIGFCRQALLHGVAKSSLWSRLQDWSQRRCIVSSRYQARELKQLGAGEVHLLPGSGISGHCAVPDRATARREFGWDDRPVVGYLGHFSRLKGVHILVDAFASRDFASAVLATAHSGIGDLPRRQARRLRDLTAVGRVRQLGVVDPVTFLAACDLIVLPFITSSVYHFPQVMLESFAAGTMVITTDVGGVGELNDGGRTGLLVPPGDDAALAAAVGQSLDRLEETHQIGKRGREVFHRELSTEVFCERFCRIVEREAGVTLPRAA